MNRMIEHVGTVERVEGNRVYVAVEVGDACQSCASRKACGLQELSHKRIVAAVSDNAAQYNIGDRVTVAAGRRTGVLAVFLSYVMPLVLLITGLSLNNLFGVSEGWSALIALGVVAAYYAVLYLLRRRIARKIQFTVLNK